MCVHVCVCMCVCVCVCARAKQEMKEAATGKTCVQDMSLACHAYRFTAAATDSQQ